MKQELYRSNATEDLTKSSSEADSGEEVRTYLDKSDRRPSALEVYLLTVPLSPEVVNFSDNRDQSPTSDKEPTFDDSTKPVLPILYVSDSECVNQKKRAILNDRKSPDITISSKALKGECKKENSVRRSKSLNSGTVSQRVSSIRDRVSAKAKEKSNHIHTIKKVNDSGSGSDTSTISQRKFSFESNRGLYSRDSSPASRCSSDEQSCLKSTLASARSRLKSSSVTTVENEPKSRLKSTSLTSFESIRSRFNASKNEFMRQGKLSSETTTINRTPSYAKNYEFSHMGKQKSLITTKRTPDHKGSRGRGRTHSVDGTQSCSEIGSTQTVSANKLRSRSAEIIGKSTISNISLTVPTNTVETVSEPDENALVIHRRERRRLRRNGSCPDIASSFDKSDSETENEEVYPRRKTPTRKRSQGRRLRIDSESSNASNDENNNSIQDLGKLDKLHSLSNKTLDSGIFEQAVSHLSEDIRILSLKYDSDDFLLDDCMSLKSGYSSATESIAESTTTMYDSTDDGLDADVRRKVPCPRDFGKPSPRIDRFAHLNSSRQKFSTGNTSVQNRIQTLSKQSHTVNQQQSSRTFQSNPASRCVDIKNPFKRNENSDSTSFKSLTSPSIHFSNIGDRTEKRKFSVGKNLVPAQSKQTYLSHSRSTKAMEQETISNECDKSTALTEELPETETSNSLEAISNAELDNSSNDKTSQQANDVNVGKVGPVEKVSSNVKPRFARNLRTSSSNIPSTENSHVSASVTEKSISKNPNKTQSNQNSLERGAENDVVNRRNPSVDNNSDCFYADQNGHISDNTRSHGRNDGLSHLAPNSPDTTTQPVTECSDQVDTPTSCPDMEVRRVPVTVNFSSHVARIKKNPIIERGDSLELNFSLDEGLDENSKSFKFKSLYGFDTIENDKTTFTDKATECNLSQLPELSDQEKSSVDSRDPTKTIVLEDEIRVKLGEDILKDVQFTLPEFLQPSEKEITVLTDSIDFSEEEPIGREKMENARLQQLLIEVEKARAGTVRALLHVNTLLNRVQDENVRLEGEVKVVSQEKQFITENLEAMKEKEGQSEDKKVEGLPG